MLDAGAELTIAAGGSFLKLDPSGVTLSGPGIKINSGGSPGTGSGQGVVMPGLPQGLDAAQGQSIGPAELAESNQRKDAPPINVESQKAALRKGNATCAVCEERQA